MPILYIRGVVTKNVLWSFRDLRDHAAGSGEGSGVVPGEDSGDGSTLTWLGGGDPLLHGSSFG